MSERDEFAWRYQRAGWCPAVLCDPAHAHTPPWHDAACASPGKVPIGRWKHLQDARRDDRAIRGELAAHPAGNLGIVLGAASGLAAVDVDSAEGAAWLRAAVGEPDAPRFRTGRGFRLLFRVTGDTVSGVLAPGVELLCRGRMTVAPPSVHPTGRRYEWDRAYDFDTARLPGLPGRLASAREYEAMRGPPAVASVSAAGSPGRNDRMFRLACALRRHGADREEVLECLSVLNRRLAPPLRASELETIARSACRYRPG